MSALEQTWRYDAENLAWEGDRASYLALEPETRRLVDGIADFLERELISDPVIHEGCHPSEDCPNDVDAEAFKEANDTLDAIAELVDLQDGVEDAVKAALERARAEGEKDATIPSRANTAERKAMRLLLERRVTIDRREGSLIVATVKGDSAVYRTGFDPNRPDRWRCTCPELRGECSHVTAVKMVSL